MDFKKFMTKGTLQERCSEAFTQDGISEREFCRLYGFNSFEFQAWCEGLKWPGKTCTKSFKRFSVAVTTYLKLRKYVFIADPHKTEVVHQKLFIHDGDE